MSQHLRIGERQVREERGPAQQRHQPIRLGGIPADHDQRPDLLVFLQTDGAPVRYARDGQTGNVGERRLGVERGEQEPGGIGQEGRPFLDSLPCRDVGGQHEESGNHAVGSHLGGVARAHPPRLPSLERDQRLEFHPLPGEHPLGKGTDRGEGGVSHDFPHPPAHNLGGREAEPSIVGFIDEHVSPLGIDVGDEGRQRVRDEPQLVLGALPLLVVRPLLQDAPDGRTQPRQVGLEHVIRGPLLDHLGRQFIPQGARTKMTGRSGYRSRAIRSASAPRISGTARSARPRRAAGRPSAST